MLQGSPPSLEVQNQLEAVFKHHDLHGCGKFHYLEGPVNGLRDPKEEWSRAVLFKFIGSHKTFPPCYEVWCGEFYQPRPADHFRVQTSLANRDNKSEDLDMEERLNKHFRVSRDAYHLMGILFECDL